MTDRSRRRFLIESLFGLGLARCGHAPLGGDAHFDDLRCAAPRTPAGPSSSEELTFDYVIVGSGAGGGPLAANLALAGWRVGLIEAGGTDGGANYDVPVFHPLASEDPATRWDYFVDHYRDLATAALDPKYVPERRGILYPRAGTVGGCTAHHAMVTVYPHNSDWDRLAAALGDPSFAADPMRRYFERLERCQYSLRDSATRSRHGFDGWLPTSMTAPTLALRDLQLLKMIYAALDAAEDHQLIENVADFLEARRRDPNDWRSVNGRGEGVFGVPVSTRDGRRAGSREYLNAVAARSETLTILTHTLATRVVFDGDLRATGVECRRGPRLYRADPHASEAAGTSLFVRARREVILAAGAFNTPQLLMLSGVGPSAELARHGVPVLLDRPGVGGNLQDRYEISVVSQMRQSFGIVHGCDFAPPTDLKAADPCYAEWRAKGRGVYSTNGIACAVVKRSRPELPDPDLFMFGAPGLFRGYFPGYARFLLEHQDCFTWAILKGHTRNTSGRVSLRTADPRDAPAVDFNYFDPSDPASAQDRDAVVHGIEFVRDILARGDSEILGELIPGLACASREELGRYVTEQAWGHHASCTAKMGRRDDPMAVVDGDFRVHGTQGLRVVDASVFPHIPGFFIVTAIYMMAEKATDSILDAAG